MNVFFRYSCLLILFFTGMGSLYSQELNATVTVNSQGIQRTDRQIFTSLEGALRTFINDRKWTAADFRPNERIDCTFTIIINEMPSDNSFNAELQVQSRRPVYNATYTTVLLNFRDTQFSFDYMEYQPLEFDPNNIAGNLAATVAFYVYLILGLDFDSMSLFGGTPYFQQMQLIAHNVQSNNWKGWEPSGSNRNRYAIATAFNDASLELYRHMWYEYHRSGLDEMAADPAKGREQIVSSVPVISSVYARRPNSVLITLFGDTKLGELANVFVRASEQEKQQAYNTLRNIYPTRTAELDKIRQPNR